MGLTRLAADSPRGISSLVDPIDRVVARDVLDCPSCRGRMRVIAAIEQPEMIAAILGSLGLASRTPRPP